METSEVSPCDDGFKGSYHHGNLKPALLREALLTIEEKGIDGLSVRLLAQRLGVSRSALYHHFKNKDELLAQIAASGFSKMYEILEDHNTSNEICDLRGRLKNSVHSYLNFAMEHPQQYQLMFGRQLWQGSDETDFQRYAKDCFRQFAQLFEEFCPAKGDGGEEAPLRLAQITWSSLHGLATLANDGILTKKKDVFLLGETLIARFV